MAKQPDSLRLLLTPEQRERVKETIGKEADAIELRVEELEERITLGGGPKP
jgi:hypothetical protein